ncbi:MAG: hypothetical protein FJ290_12355 [Planctomycetes bacterium]|nr:hypothetical protein [Planctomycetota bacterium]
MFQRRRDVRGQATTEYILIVVLVAVLSIGIITVFGNQVRDLFRVATDRMAGGDATINPAFAAQAPGLTNQNLSKLKENGN